LTSRRQTFIIGIEAKKTFCLTTQKQNEEIKMLSRENTILLVIDMQEKLTRVMAEKEQLILNLQKLIKGANALGIPVVLTEQYPQGLGATIPEVVSLLPVTKPLAKMAFSCCGDIEILESLKKLKRQQVLVAGIETHVCVYQTATDLLKLGFEPQVVIDCVSSRTLENKNIAIEKMRDTGAKITSVETALFELLKTAENKNFKEISRIVK
jgi:nicotinamidase-related amidase